MGRAWPAFVTLILAFLPSLQALSAPAYVGSAQISPFLVSSHLQRALDHLRWAEFAMRSTKGHGEVPFLNLGPTRQSLADAADQLGSARMRTVDPVEIGQIDALLAGIEALRDMLDREILKAGDRFRSLQAELLSLHQAVRSQITRTEAAISREETAVQPVIR